ncbi:MAG: DUF4115 domain-containing protein [Vicinamibacterales bacterium]
MAETAERQTPFDERAALEELERLRQGIEHYRQQRKKVVDQFDQFVSTFKASSDPVVDLLPTPGEAGALAQAGLAPSLEPMDALTARLRGNRSEEWSASTAEVASAPEIPAPRVDIPQFSKAPRIFLLVLLVVAFGGVIGWSIWHRTRTPAASVVDQAPAPAETAPAPPPASEAVTPPARGPAAAPHAELTTTRSVWLRITVDGDRVLERQLPADTRIPLTPETTIVIRTGDAGAVRLAIDGKDQGVLGRDGEVVTKTFTIRPTVSR